MPFQIIRNDITKVKADAIVNTANPRPVIGGGTDSAIYQAAGKELLLAERRKIGEIARGDAAVTPAFALNARYIIHTVGPVWVDGDHGERDTLRSCYKKSLALAADLSCESIAFPMISTGVYSFPKDEALEIVLDTVRNFLTDHEMDVTLVVFDSQSLELSKELVGEIEEYIDEHSVGILRDREYGFFRYHDYRRRMDEKYRWMSEEKSPTLPRSGAGVSRKAKPSSKKSKGPVSADIALPCEAGFEEDLAIENDMAFPECSPEEIDRFSDLMDTKAKITEPPLPAPAVAPKKEHSPIPLDYEETDLRSFIEQKGENFQQRLFRLIDERGLKDSDVYNKANISRQTFSKIRCNADYKPGKKNVVALGIALELDMREMRELLSSAGFAFSPGSLFDLIICYFIDRKKYNIFTIDAALFDYCKDTLSNSIS